MSEPAARWGINCTSRWHKSGLAGFAAPYRVYECQRQSESWASMGRECIRCGFRTFRVTDSDGYDVTDGCITRRYEPSLFRRVVGDLQAHRTARRTRRARKLGCYKCDSTTNPDGGIRREDDRYLCEQCVDEMIQSRG